MGLDVGSQSAHFLLHLLKNAESIAELKGLDVDPLVIEHLQVSRAEHTEPNGRLTHASSPGHRGKILTEK